MRKPCRGRIEIIYVDHLGDGSIFWHCPRCRDKGRIYGWVGSCWDEMQSEKKSRRISGGEVY